MRITELKSLCGNLESFFRSEMSVCGENKGGIEKIGLFKRVTKRCTKIEEIIARLVPIKTYFVEFQDNY